MTPLRRWSLPALAAFLLLSFVPTAAEVVNSMRDCEDFLLKRTPPQVPGILEGGNIRNKARYKTICQTFKNKRRFVTLYDTENKIPVFSAYKYRGNGEGGQPKPRWKIEPQLEERNTNNMRDERFTHQATDNDYKNATNYNRGHLFPVCHAYDTDEKKSTFTLTNIVPQAVSFNGGSWQKMETCVKCVMQSYCVNNNGATEGFVVTGSQPSNNNKLNNRVNIPSILWSAFCCYSHNMKKWLASAHWGDNVAEDKSKYLQTKTLAELHQELSTGRSRFEVFPRTKCPLHTTVAEFYPDLNAQNKKCQCPPQDATTTAPPTTTTYTTTTFDTTGTTTTATTTTTTTDDTGNPPGGGRGGGGGGGRAGDGGDNTMILTEYGPTTSTTIPTTSGPQNSTTNQTLTTVPTTSEPQTNTNNYISTTIPATSRPQTNTNNHILTTIPTISGPQNSTTNQTSTTITTTSGPQTSTTNQTSTTVTTTSGPQTSTTNQTSTTIPAISQPQTNITNQTSTTITTTSEPQTNITNQTSTTIPAISRPQTNTNNHILTTIPTTSRPQTNRTFTPNTMEAMNATSFHSKSMQTAR